MIKNHEDSYIYGKNPVCEILMNNPKRINKIYIQKGISYDISFFVVFVIFNFTMFRLFNIFLFCLFFTYKM